MPIRPEDIQAKKFKVVKGIRQGGYDEVEVDTFLDEIEVEFSRVLEENAALRQRLEAALNAPPPQPVASEAEEMLRRTLLLAQRTADETVAAAQAEAERLTGDARATASTVVESARAQAAAATADLERRRQALEQHIEGLRAFEREYRTRLKAYLESQLRDLDGRTQPAAVEEAPAPPAAPVAPVAAPAAPVAAPPPPAATQPAATFTPGVAPGVTATVVTEPEDTVPYDGSFDAGEPEPFDIDEGESGVPRLAP